MKDYIVIEKDKTVASFLCDLVLYSVDNVSTKTEDIAYLSAPDLFSLDYEDNDNKHTIRKITVKNDQDLKILKRIIEENNVSTVDNESFVYLVSYVDNDFLKKIKDFSLNRKNSNFRVISPFVVDKKKPLDFFVDVLVKLSKEKLKEENIVESDIRWKVDYLLDRANNSHELIIPFLREIFKHEETLSNFITMKDKDFMDFAGKFVVNHKKESLFLWDWRKMFEVHDFKKFEQLLKNLSSQYGYVVLLRHMQRELNEIIKTKALVDSGIALNFAVKISNNRVKSDKPTKNIINSYSLEKLGKMNKRISSDYNLIMSHSSRSDYIFESLTSFLWTQIHGKN